LVSGTLAKTGRAFGSTSNRKLSESVPAPSLTVTVIQAVPASPVAGVTVTVRSAPLPPKTMPASGVNAGFEVARLRLSAAMGLSTSLSVKASGPAGVFCGVSWSGMSEMTGGALVALTVTVTRPVAESAPSESV